MSEWRQKAQKYLKWLPLNGSTFNARSPWVSSLKDCTKLAWQLSLDWQLSVAQRHPNIVQWTEKKDVISLKRVELGFMFPFVSLPKSFTYNKHSHQNSLMTSKSWLLIIYHRVLPLVSSSYTLTCKMCFLRACHILLSIQLFTGMILNEKHSYLPGNLCHTPNTILSVIT